MISAIVAVDENNGIGYKNKLLCNIKDDLKHFKETTTNSMVVMGRKTWDSLPNKPLPNRVNIVITNSVECSTFIDGAIFMPLHTLKRHIDDFHEKSDIYIIGGSQIYNELISYCDYIHLTKIYKSFENVDTYFPEIDKQWYLLDAEPIQTQDNIKYQSCIYKRTKGE